jgi:hypothetical protein
LFDNQWSQLFLIHLDDKLQVRLSNGFFHLPNIAHINIAMSLKECVGNGKGIFEECEYLLVVLNDELLLDSLNDLLEKVIEVLDNDGGDVRRIINLSVDPRHNDIIVGVEHGLEDELEAHILGGFLADHIEHCLDFLLVSEAADNQHILYYLLILVGIQELGEEGAQGQRGFQYSLGETIHEEVCLNIVHSLERADQYLEIGFQVLQNFQMIDLKEGHRGEDQLGMKHQREV